MTYGVATLRRVHLTGVFVALCAIGIAPCKTNGQMTGSLLTSRADLTAAAEQADRMAAGGDKVASTRSAVLAASIRQRLRDGDFQPGDRIVLTVMSNMRHTDTLVVSAERNLELPGKLVLPLKGVLRSELEGLTAAEVRKYVKAEQVKVIPLTRIGVLGEVTHPGYFALPSGVPITDAIMAAGGPTGTADLERTVVRRDSREYRSPEETRRAVSSGLTIDQFGLRAGDELVVGKKRSIMNGPLLGLVGSLASLSAIIVTLSR